MEEYIADAFVNREKLIPVIAILDNNSSSSNSKDKRDRLKELLINSKDKLKKKLYNAINLDSKDYNYSL